MLEGIPIILHVVVVVIRIGERNRSFVQRCSGCSCSFSAEYASSRVHHLKHLFGAVVQVPPGLVYRRLAIRVSISHHLNWVLHVYRSVIGSDHHFGPHRPNLFHDVAQRENAQTSSCVSDRYAGSSSANSRITSISVLAWLKHIHEIVDDYI